MSGSLTSSCGRSSSSASAPWARPSLRKLCPTSRPAPVRGCAGTHAASQTCTASALRLSFHLLQVRVRPLRGRRGLARGGGDDRAAALLRDARALRGRACRRLEAYVLDRLLLCHAESPPLCQRPVSPLRMLSPTLTGSRCEGFTHPRLRQR